MGSKVRNKSLVFYSIMLNEIYTISRLLQFSFFANIFYTVNVVNKGQGNYLHTAPGSNPSCDSKCLGESGQVTLGHSNNIYLKGLLGEFKTMVNIKYLVYCTMHKK